LVSWTEFQTRYPSKSEILEWFEKFPEAQIGIITGPISNLTVVDFEKGADPSEIPQDTMIVESGNKGYHYYFQYEPSMTNKARIKPLTDVRSKGGFVVAAGSTSEKGTYTLLQDLPLLPFPKELFPPKIDIFQYPSSSSTFEKRPINDYPGYGAGSRNDEIARFIGYILTQIHPADWDTEGWSLIVNANNKNTPPLSSYELSNTFNSIKRTERTKNPLGRSTGRIEASRGMSEPDTPIIFGEDDEVMHIADVADLQKINSDDVFPLEMPCFDEIINGGVSLGDVVIIAGQTGHGKTTLAQDWTMSLIRGEKSMKALWFSYEVLPVHLWKKFKEMGMSREDCAFIPAKHSTGNVAWVEQKIKEGKEKFGTRAVFIDHLGFLLPKTNGVLGKTMSANYASFLTQIMRDLKTLALQEEVIIFLPVHMKKVDSRNRMSDSDDIKDSSGIGQESDLVFLIEREKNKEKDAKTYFTDMTKITLAKNRKTGLTLVANFSMLNGRFCFDDSNNEEKKSLSNYAQLEAPNAYDQDDGEDVEAEPTQQVMIGE
jgi:hypothetical protein